MKSSKMKSWLILIMTVALMPAANAFAVSSYNVTLLNDPGSKYALPSDINLKGQVVGREKGADGVTQAFLWEKGVFQNLGTMGGTYAGARGINNKGQIVGGTDNYDGSMAAFLWQNNSSQLLNGMQEARGINDAGQVVGNLNAGQAAIWANGSILKDLNNGDYPYSYGNAINAVGNAAVDAGGPPDAFLWDAAGMHYLGSLGFFLSTANGINDSNQIVGDSFTPSFNPHGYLWQNGVMLDLGTLGGNQSGAYDINNRGQIVGTAETSEGNLHAMLYENGTMYDLNQLIPSVPGLELYEAKAVNDKGWIVGSAFVNDYSPLQGFLLTPVPEPTSMLLLASGLIGMLGFKKKIN